MKKWYASKTLWVGLAVVILGALDAAQGLTLPPGWTSALGVVMVALRVVTGTAVIR